LEAAFDNAAMSEVKRGRPHTFPYEWMSFLRSLHSSHVHTDRQLQNIAYATRAMHILKQVPDKHDEYSPATWLLDWAGADRGKEGAINWAILEQLGRFAYAGFPDDIIRELADDIEQWKPKAKVGAAYLRGLRRSVLPVPKNRRLPPSSLKTGLPA
jgi:hypothetical protein